MLLLLTNPPVPVKAAETLCDPTESEVVLVVALPNASTVTGEPGVPSMVKTTDPVGVPPPLVTVAVKVTLEPKVEGLGVEVRAVLVVAVTLWVTAEPLLNTQPPVPEK